MVRSALRRQILGLVALITLVGCTEQQFRLGFERDLAPPQIAIVKTAGDTLDVSQGIVFSIVAADNLGLKTVTVSFTGALAGIIDTTFTVAVTNATLGVAIPLPSNTTVGGTLYIQASALDGNNNAATASDSLFMINLAALLVAVTEPPSAQVTGPGVQMPIQIRASQSAGIRRVGYTVFGTVNAADSSAFALPDTAFFNDTLLVPVGTPPGQFFIQGFAIDSANRRASSPIVTVTVQQILVDSFPPTVGFTVNKRVEIGDTITVTASDFSGIRSVGWFASDSLGATLVRDSVVFATPVSPVIRQFSMSFPANVPGRFIQIGAFAWDGATPSNQGTARLAIDTSVVRQDTVLVVQGITRPLPVGGQIVDAIYNPNRNEVYLTNIALGRVEVFQVATTSFAPAGILQGSRPWGIALWPRDTTTGANGDTVLVANSGGTNISIVNVAVSPPREVRRHALPSFAVQTVKTVIDPQSQSPIQEIIEYHFDDRPQYLGATCRGASVCRPTGAGDVIAVYSTTPTLGQSTPFPRRASMRWENITNPVPESHFFWEHAAAQASAVNDTIQVIVRRNGISTTLLHASCGVRIALSELGFLDTTFVRNSGNFLRTLVGEAGAGTPALEFARAITYHVNAGSIATCARDTTTPPDGVIDVFYPLTEDLGISPALDVRNFITNVASSVKSISVNFNGLTNMIRADSVYVLDRFLRLQGLIAVGGLNFGMDQNFDHNFDARSELSPTGLSPNDRIVFLASELPEILVYDTYFFGRATGSIPIRDPVIGPLRVAKLPTGEQLLVGVTTRGVVTVRLPAITNVLQAPGR